ncbi:hypothetical protein NUH88_07840 [Nisaea acidiphila]|uniref:Uncharacterized protein n=1 Tax=Nisaea acidiphila TaxID=1862145 RepID=A0A9J7AWV1_9PROT|nr:hypothetical protein [Nisaea acidiphila]UUX51598.1 hypothetical protein NUH88_07840 [Nisaea acidiphila]
MSDCIDQNFPCQNPDYSIFDTVATNELNSPDSASDIVNHSWFCSIIPTDEKYQIGDLNSSKYLKPMHGRMGIYHLWTDYDECDEHQTYIMKCQYVGKGPPSIRVASHIKSKWPKEATLFFTFHECENRIAKYYEQLFLDTYNFALNDNENGGAEILYAVWDKERYELGTHPSEISSYSKMNGLDDL